MDWNHDGKIGYKDHAFYSNVIKSGSKNTGTQYTGVARKTTLSKASNSQDFPNQAGKVGEFLLE